MYPAGEVAAVGINERHRHGLARYCGRISSSFLAQGVTHAYPRHLNNSQPGEGGGMVSLGAVDRQDTAGLNPVGRLTIVIFEPLGRVPRCVA